MPSRIDRFPVSHVDTGFAVPALGDKDTDAEAITGRRAFDYEGWLAEQVDWQEELSRPEMLARNELYWQFVDNEGEYGALFLEGLEITEMPDENKRECIRFI